MTECPICRGAEWVCEAHDDKAWPAECDCAPGKPCVCNKATPPSPTVTAEEWEVVDGPAW